MQISDLDNRQKADAALMEFARANEPMQEYIGRMIGINRCMYTGKHWITEDTLYKYDTLGRHLVNLNPDTPKLRVVLNRIPRFIHETAAATFPDMIDYDVSPPDREFGAEASMRASVEDSTLAHAVKHTGFLEAAREANYRRCIDGIHGIGISATFANRDIGGQEEEDCTVKAFAFSAHNLILDAGNQSLDLWDHDCVVYKDVWTVAKIRRTYGIDLMSPDIPGGKANLKTVGDLLPQEMAMYDLSQGRLYRYLKQYSETKGAVVYQIHIKDDTGRFSRMAVAIDAGGREKIWVNFDNQESPYGGCGLPFMLLHGYRDPDNMVSTSDVSLLKQDQDQINLLRTMFARIHQKHAGFQWLVDENAFNGDREDYRSFFNNYVAGFIPYKGGTRDRPSNAPQLVQYPAPHPYLQDAITLHQERDMPQQIHRAPVTAGATKSHVPDATFQSALQAASQVLGNRQREDTGRYDKFGETMLGTYTKLVQEGRPSVLVSLRREQFDATDFSVLQTVDPYYPACDIRLTERSIRFRSTEQKEESLNKAAELQMVTAEEYRLGRAALDLPVTEQDRLYDMRAKKAAMRVLMGEEWSPRPLDRAQPFYLAAFGDATLDPRAEADPAAMQRLVVARQSMLDYANAELAARTQAENPQVPTESVQTGQQQTPEMPEEVNIADLLTSLNSGGGGQQTQPIAA